jgi:hypothetical protein
MSNSVDVRFTRGRTSVSMPSETSDIRPLFRIFLTQPTESILARFVRGRKLGISGARCWTMKIAAGKLGSSRRSGVQCVDPPAEAPITTMSWLEVPITSELLGVLPSRGRLIYRASRSCDSSPNSTGNPFLYQRCGDSFVGDPRVYLSERHKGERYICICQH